MVTKSLTSVLPVEELISPANLVDYDGAPLEEPRFLSAFKSKNVDPTTCLFPFEVEVPKSPYFPYGKRYVPCGHCEDCLRRKRNGWFLRIKHEANSHLLNLFVTLTYDDDNLPFSDWPSSTGVSAVVPCVSRDHITNFFKRLRKAIAPDKVRYYGISEYGPQTFRPHYHFILFNWPPERDSLTHIIKAWGLAENITVTPLNDEQIMYCCRYHTDKGFTPQGYQKTFTFMSRNPGIGACYADDPSIQDWHSADEQRALYSLNEKGRKVGLPRYLRQRIYGKDFECPAPLEQPKDTMTRAQRYSLYYAKKAKRRAKLQGKI